MDELDDLIPRPVAVMAGGEAIEVHPLRVRQFGAMMRAIAPVQPAFHLDTREVDAEALLQSAAGTEIIAIGINRPYAFAAALSPDERITALLTVIGVSPAFFFPSGDAAADADAENVFGDAFQRLISAGHRWPDILDYTLEQVQRFGAAAARAETARERTALLIARAAVADRDAFRGLLDALSPAPAMEDLPDGE